jgi:hypothetical protein
VFAPQKIAKYHQAHPRNQPFPHKRGAQTRGRVISLPLIAPCLTPQSTPQTNRHVNRRPPHIASPSPAQSPPPLPIPFPRAEIAIEVDVDEEYLTTPPNRRPSPSNQVHSPLSPRSALAVLQAFGTGGDVENLRSSVAAALEPELAESRAGS